MDFLIGNRFPQSNRGIGSIDRQVDIFGDVMDRAIRVSELQAIRMSAAEGKRIDPGSVFAVRGSKIADMVTLAQIHVRGNRTRSDRMIRVSPATPAVSRRNIFAHHVGVARTIFDID